MGIGAILAARLKTTRRDGSAEQVLFALWSPPGGGTLPSPEGIPANVSAPMAGRTSSYARPPQRWFRIRKPSISAGTRAFSLHPLPSSLSVMPGRETEVPGSRILLRRDGLTVPPGPTATFPSMAACRGAARWMTRGWRPSPARDSGRGHRRHPDRPGQVPAARPLRRGRLSASRTGRRTRAACAAGGGASATAPGKTLSAAEACILGPTGNA